MNYATLSDKEEEIMVGARHASPKMQIRLIQMPDRCGSVGEACLAPTTDWHAFTILNRTLGSQNT